MFALKYSVLRFPAPRAAVTQLSQRATYIVPTKQRRTITVYEPLPDAHKGKTIMDNIRESLFEKYDPSGWRRNLINKKNSDCLRSGDIIRVNYKNQPNNSFMGYVLAIDRNGPDSTILLRNKVTKIGVEMRISLFNPIIERIDIVKRPAKYNGRNRHYYIRDTRLDVDDLEALAKKRRI